MGNSASRGRLALLKRAGLGGQRDRTCSTKQQKNADAGRWRHKRAAEGKGSADDTKNVGGMRRCQVAGPRRPETPSGERAAELKGLDGGAATEQQRDACACPLVDRKRGDGGLRWGNEDIVIWRRGIFWLWLWLWLSARVLLHEAAQPKQAPPLIFSDGSSPIGQPCVNIASPSRSTRSLVAQVLSRFASGATASIELQTSSSRHR